MREQRHRQAARASTLRGGVDSAMSLAQLSEWCAQRFGQHPVASDAAPRPFDIPWMVLDSALGGAALDWQPRTPTGKILDEIADHAGAESANGWNCPRRVMSEPTPTPPDL